MRCLPHTHTKKLHMCEADYLLTCNCDACLVIVRLIMLSYLLECYINICLSDRMLCNCFLFLFFFLLFYYMCVYIYIYLLCVCVCVCICMYVCVCICICVDAHVRECIGVLFNRNVRYKTGFV